MQLVVFEESDFYWQKSYTLFVFKPGSVEGTKQRKQLRSRKIKFPKCFLLMFEAKISERVYRYLGISGKTIQVSEVHIDFFNDGMFLGETKIIGRSRNFSNFLNL